MDAAIMTAYRWLVRNFWYLQVALMPCFLAGTWWAETGGREYLVQRFLILFGTLICIYLPIHGVLYYGTQKVWEKMKPPQGVLSEFEEQMTSGKMEGKFGTATGMLTVSVIDGYLYIYPKMRHGGEVFGLLQKISVEDIIGVDRGRSDMLRVRYKTAQGVKAFLFRLRGEREFLQAIGFGDF
ncbi:MAG TPA: hypothetical protein VGL56_09510 [Fimbriimonadaceae bacterium]|jgi:hypothetical protein